MPGAQPFCIDTEPARRARPETLDNDIGRGDQPAENVRVSGTLQIERHALLASIEEQVVQAPAVEQRRQVAHRVAARRILDLDDFSAELREHLRGECAWKQPGEIDDPDTGERAGLRGDGRHGQAGV